MTMCNVTVVAHSEKPTEIYHLTQLSGAFWRLSGHCFGLRAHTFTVLAQSHQSCLQSAGSHLLF